MCVHHDRDGLRAQDMDFILDVMDTELDPQVYVLERPNTPWRPLLRDDPIDYPFTDDEWDIL